MSEVWHYLIAEITALGWRCFALGPEFWLGVAIWGSGVCFGVIFSWIAVAISDRNENRKNNDEHDATQLTAKQTEQEE